jgi:dipeptidyl aminopeptidase/acylaminoacyl peptidase
LKLLALIPILALPLAAARPPFTPDDLWDWRTVSDARISPDGQWVIYVEAWNDRSANREFANLRIASTDGRTRREFTKGSWRDGSPRWSPDGTRVAWISDRGGRPQIFEKAVASGTDRQATQVEASPLTFAWSPDGKSFAYTVRAPAEGAAPWAPPAILPRLERSGYVQLRATSADHPLSTAACPVVGEPAWMIDGQRVLAGCEDGRIYAFPLSGTPKALVTEPGRNEGPVVSPDGSRIAWLSTRDATQSYAIRKLYVMNHDGTRVRILSGSLDRDATDPQWSSDSRTVYFVADDSGSTHVYAARNDGTVRKVTTASERLSGFTLADNGRAATVRSTASEGGEVFSFTVDQVTQPVTLDSPNGHLLAEREIGQVEEAGAARAWMVKPPGFDRTRKYPLLVEIGDSPRRMCGPDFDLRAQIAAARGYVVMCANPRGTPGYGEVYGNLIHTGLPADAYDDLMRAVDAAVATGYIDPQRLAITGGLLAAWAIGHTDRFHAAVLRRAVADWATHVALAPDGLRRAQAWLGALPWDDPGGYQKRSPIFWAGNFRTPALVLAGGNDAEAEMLYFALKARKVDSALVRIPGDPAPADRILELETVLAWLGR